MPTEASLDAHARRAAKRVGLYAQKSRWRLNTVDNWGGFQIIDPYLNMIEAGEKFDLSAEEVIAYCAGEK